MAKRYKPISELTECPYCGSQEEWYRKQTYKGTCKIGKKFSGEEAETYHCGTNIYDNAFHKDTSKFAFCGECDRKIGLL